MKQQTKTKKEWDMIVRQRCRIVKRVEEETVRDTERGETERNIGREAR